MFLQHEPIFFNLLKSCFVVDFSADTKTIALKNFVTCTLSIVEIGSNINLNETNSPKHFKNCNAFETRLSYFYWLQVIVMTDSYCKCEPKIIKL